jgi:FAD/FMN-containing dehydrogenase
MSAVSRGSDSASSHPDGAFNALRDRLNGHLVQRGDAEFEDTRRVFNAMIDRHPAAIVRCADSSDVVEAVNFARESGLLVTVRSGGHGVAGHCIADDGLMIDLSPMKGLTVDTDRRIAYAQPGLRLGEFINGTERYGMVSPTGTVSDTGIGGLTLGGGFGWLMGKYGLAVDNIAAADVVLASGELVHASEDENPDLLWALRGGSGNFGVVTTFEMKVYPLTQVLGGMLIHPFAHARDVMEFYREAAAKAPDELTLMLAFITDPQGNQVVAIMACWSGGIEEGEAVLAPIRAFGPPLADLIHPMPYSEMITLVDEATAPSFRHYWKMNLLQNLDDAAVDTIIAHVARVPSPRTVVLIDHVHGAVRRVAPTAAAFPHRDYPHGIQVLSMWPDEADDEQNIQWTREITDATRPFSTGGLYVNETQDEKISAAWGINYRRLTEIKSRYDPNNLFRHNANIPPGGGTAGGEAAD